MDVLFYKSRRSLNHNLTWFWAFTKRSFGLLFFNQKMSCSGWSCCPFCSQQVRSIELQRHANSHFEDDDLARDVQLAIHYQDVDDDFPPQHIPVENPETHILTAANSNDEENILLTSQAHVRRDSQFVNHGHDFITLLKNCLECDASATGKSSSTTTTSLLSGYVNHFQSLEFEDVGWGCGWRNIQMLTSHLLNQRQHERHDVLFGGAGFVPDIPSLQRWLEIAWDKGFDTAGSNDFHQKICGKRAWIGTTECAALFRSFGLRARIVDFCSTSATQTRSTTTTLQVIGPMDRYLNKPSAQVVVVDTDATTSSSNHKSLGISPELVKGHQLLTNWVWSYFSDNKLTIKSGCNQVAVTHKPPLYFQHDGHSRTIVGIQLKSLPNGSQQPNLLILDPAHKTQVLESCLTKKVGWQRFIKRGVHTLKKTEYQLCYMDPGVATGPELEKLKILDSTRFEF